MSKTKELIICIISIIALILAVTTTVFATEDLNSLMGNATNTENNDFQQIEDTTNNTNNNNNTNTNTNTNASATTNNTNTNSNVNKTATIPYTGIDYSVLLIIAICGVSAVYAYKKIRDYNV